MKIPLPSHSLSYYVDLFFKEANRIVDILDHSAINTVSAFSPWLAPFAPAVLVYNHLINKLGFGSQTSFIVACVIEFVGISAVSIYLRILQHNKKSKDDKDRVSSKGALFAGGFYFGILIIVNVVLEIDIYIGHLIGVSVDAGITISHVLAMGLISLLSLPAAILLSSRAAYQDIVNRLITEKQERKEEQELRRKERQGVMTHTDKSTATVMTNVDITAMTIDDIMRQFGVSERTAYRKRAKALKNGHKQNDEVHTPEV